MASIFTYQDEPPRIQSPWSTSGTNTPLGGEIHETLRKSIANGVTKLEAERQDGPTEYKLHLLLRQRRKFTSTSTTNVISGSQHSKPFLSSSNTRSLSETSLQPVYQPSNHTRQARLQQLTTQLLWRLQQSSPFHSSSNANLILPVLPEATPRLRIPDRPTKLLPGLEESQGALYEIGVADDGTLIGLVEDELEESLTNLRAMAASLGCVVDVLRRITVGDCEWIEYDNNTGESLSHANKLWVAEVLVRPDSRRTSDQHLIQNPMDTNNTKDLPAEAEEADTEQMRVALVGATTTGKSSLLGTLSTSTLDNGRGKSRLSLLKHRHEIASGITSSVAQELIGYDMKENADSVVINYASGDVSSWPDIHNLSDRLVFLSDSPGLPRYSKSMFRSLISWNPHWILFCIAADDTEENATKTGATNIQETLHQSSTIETTDLSLAHLDLCLRVNIPLIVVVTKMDLATKSGLRLVLGKILSALKLASRKPLVLSTASTPVLTFALDSANALPDLQYINVSEESEVERVIQAICQNSENIVPIVMTSAVSGSGIGKLHALLKSLPTHVLNKPVNKVENTFEVLFHVDEVFSIPPSRVYSSDSETNGCMQGVVLCGHVNMGKISVGDVLCLGPFAADETVSTTQSVPRSKSLTSQEMRQVASRSIPSQVAKSYQDDGWKSSRYHTAAVFRNVRVVSLRNLRLPVRVMHEGQTGTIGIEPQTPLDQHFPNLQRTRKGMVLCKSMDDLVAHHTFTASFPTSDFANASSPPLILGGHALVYTNSIRATVKVTTVSLSDDESSIPDGPIDLFDFDNEPRATDMTESGKQVRITFRFVSSVEYLQVGAKVLVVPTLNMGSGHHTGTNDGSGGFGGGFGGGGGSRGPNTSAPISASGLAGFIGAICEVEA